MDSSMATSNCPPFGKINAGFDVVGSDIPGWKNAGPNQNDSGIEASGGGHNGSYPAYFREARAERIRSHRPQCSRW